VSARDVPQRGKPNRIIYSITETGREALLTWSRQPCAPDPVKDDFLVRLYGLEHMDVEALREHLLQRLEGHQERLAEFTEIANATEPSSIAALGRLRGQQIGLRYEREWAEWCKETLDALSPENLAQLNNVVQFTPGTKEDVA